MPVLPNDLAIAVHHEQIRLIDQRQRQFQHPVLNRIAPILIGNCSPHPEYRLGVAIVEAASGMMIEFRRIRTEQVLEGQLVAGILIVIDTAGDVMVAVTITNHQRLPVHSSLALTTSGASVRARNTSSPVSRRSRRPVRALRCKTVISPGAMEAVTHYDGNCHLPEQYGCRTSFMKMPDCFEAYRPLALIVATLILAGCDSGVSTGGGGGGGCASSFSQPSGFEQEFDTFTIGETTNENPVGADLDKTLFRQFFKAARPADSASKAQKLYEFMVSESDAFTDFNPDFVDEPIQKRFR